MMRRVIEIQVGREREKERERAPRGIVGMCVLRPRKCPQCECGFE
jgi:hypothetical protein